MRCVTEAHPAVVLAVAVASCLFPAVSCPQAPPAFPTKTVRYVVPFGAGGSPDLVARLIADRLTQLWGQQVIVDNRAGVAGVMGTAFVAKSPPDGHTLVQCNVASSGIGYLMVKGQSNISTSIVMSGMIAIGVVGLLIDVALRRLQQVIETRRGL